MKCTIPEISWHNRDPVLSVDIQPANNEEFYRLASGGTDCHVLIWYLKTRQNGGVDVDIVSDLTRHQRAVNVVRWSPSGEYLATGDDDANIIVWNLKTDNIPLLDGESSDKETWVVNKILRGHKEDVYDICWSPSGLKLISGSIDNTAILWDLSKGLNEHILSDHKGFVQGVSWDPKGEYIATLSSDRICRIFSNTGRHVKSRIYKGLLPVPESHALFNKEIKYFHDDTFKSYFRRLAFSPDGNLLFTPSGCVETEDYKAVKHATLVFTLDCLKQPAAILPSPKQETIAVCCCPLLFELHSEGVDPVVRLPYRMIFAVATDSDVVLYDTQQFAPFAHFQRIHYTRITDLTWSSDGLLLIASSTDGFCTLITFERNELGVQYVKEESETEDSVFDVSGCEELDKTESISTKNKEKEALEVKPRKPSMLEQWAIRKSAGDVEVKNSSNKTREVPEGNKLIKVDVPDIQKIDLVKPAQKRIAPIKIGDVRKKPKLDEGVKTSSEEAKVVKQEPSSGKETKSDLSSSTLKKKGKMSDGVLLKKQGVESKKVKPNRNSPLLKFFQASTTPKRKPCNENTATLGKDVSDTSKLSNNIIEISDDESNDTSVSNKTDDVILVEDSKTDVSSCFKKLSQNVRVVATRLEFEKGDMETEEIECADAELGVRSNEYKKDTRKNDIKVGQTPEENMQTDKIVKVDNVKKRVQSELTTRTKEHSEKENIAGTVSSKDVSCDKHTENLTTTKVNHREKENVHNVQNDISNLHHNTEDTEKSNTADVATESKSNTFPLKGLTSKTSRRIKPVTLSSPKRQKKL